jgi:mono/diheme cytochrome c family protein
MYDQPRDKTYSANPMFSDDASSRMPPAGTVGHSRGDLAGSSSGLRGADLVERDARAGQASGQPYPITEELLVRGRERYSIYCLPCHSPAGDGDGRIVRRGFPAPPSYHIDRLRHAPDRHIYDVISNGYGVMASYGARVDPSDRWAIVAYIRALQLSQHAQVADLPPTIAGQVQEQLAKSAPGAEP